MFWFRLAATLGMSVREAQQRIDSAEFGEWMAFNSIAPIGQERSDYGFASVAYYVVNALVSKHVPFEDFLLFNRPEREFPSQEELTAKLMAFKRSIEASTRGSDRG